MPVYIRGHSSPMFPLTREAFCYGRDDIGDTYIEVDMTQQKMYYYERGTAAGDGCGDRQHAQTYGNTGGVNFVYNKQKDRVLRGPGYASCEILGTCKGQHRYPRCQLEKRVRRDIYQTAGSHGCINTPKDKMEELYDMVRSVPLS